MAGSAEGSAEAAGGASTGAVEATGATDSETLESLDAGGAAIAGAGGATLTGEGSGDVSFNGAAGVQLSTPNQITPHPSVTFIRRIAFRCYQGAARNRNAAGERRLTDQCAWPPPSRYP